MKKTDNLSALKDQTGQEISRINLKLEKSQSKRRKGILEKTKKALLSNLQSRVKPITSKSFMKMSVRKMRKNQFLDTLIWTQRMLLIRIN